MNILEEFWHGNIEPAEYDTSSSKKYKEIIIIAGCDKNFNVKMMKNKR